MSAIVEQFANYPRQGNFEEKRQLILREAARLFVEKGVHETSLNEIAGNFHISKPALYHYANSKDHIITQILDAATVGNRAMLDAAHAHPGSGLEKLLKALSLYGDAMNTEFGRCMAMIQPSAYSDATRELHRKTHRILLDGMAQIVNIGIADGSIRACQPKVLVLALLNCLNSTVRWFDPGGVMSRNAVLEELLGYFLDGVQTR
ncbi:MAG: TetR/AcrR family transcriptional regulator [Panacagrimonas sp.]